MSKQAAMHASAKFKFHTTDLVALLIVPEGPGGSSQEILCDPKKNTPGVNICS